MLSFHILPDKRFMDHTLQNKQRSTRVPLHAFHCARSSVCVPLCFSILSHDAHAARCACVNAFHNIRRMKRSDTESQYKMQTLHNNNHSNAHHIPTCKTSSVPPSVCILFLRFCNAKPSFFICSRKSLPPLYVFPTEGLWNDPYDFKV